MNVHIIGGGLSALTAANILRARAVDVTVHCKTTPVDTVTQRSVHVTPFSMADLTLRSGIDFSQLPGIKALDTVEAAVYTSARGFRSAVVNSRLFSFHAIYRGVHSDQLSIDSGLFRLALARGVEFTQDPVDLNNPPPGQVILATGLTPETYTKLGIPTKKINGYFYRSAVSLNELSARIFFCPGILKDYFYSGRLNGIEFGGVFDSTGALPAKFREFITVFSKYYREEHEWVSAPQLAVPDTNKAFFYQDYPKGGRVILAGTVAPGMIDPVFYFGIVGVIKSGCIAADAVLSGIPKAQKEFDSATANYSAAVRFRRFYDRLPGTMVEKIYDSIAHGEIAGYRALNALKKYPFVYQWAVRTLGEGIPGMAGYLADNLPRLHVRNDR